MDNTVIEWNQIVLLVIGSLIGFVFSMATIFVQRKIDKAGNTRVYYKFTGLGDSIDGWGFFGAPTGGVTLWLPVIFELENTKHSPVLYRDLKISLFFNGNFVADTDFINKLPKGKEFGNGEGSNSFVVSGQSINRYNCLYKMTVPDNQIEKYRFDCLKIHYYNFKGKEKFKIMRSMDGDWKIDNKGTDDTFLLVK